MSEKLATVHELRHVQHPDIKEVNAGLVRYELAKHKEELKSTTARQQAIGTEFNKTSSA